MSSPLADGKIVVITGGGRGIGRETALLFAEEGAAAVVVADVDEAQGSETVELVREHGSDGVHLTIDVSRADDVKRMVNETVRIFGRVDAAYNNAALLGPMQPLHECSLAHFDSTTGVNLRGVFLCMKYQILAMLSHGGGAIVNASSGAGVAASGACLYMAPRSTP